MHMGGGGWHGGRGLDSLSEDEALGRVYDHKVVMRFANYVKPYKRLSIISILSMLIYTVTTVSVPYMVKIAIDDYITSSNFIGLNWIALLFLVNMLLNFGANYIYLVALAKVNQAILYQLRTNMFQHIQKLSVSFHDSNQAGKVMSRVQNDVTQLQEFLQVVVLTLADGLSLIGIVGVMFIMDVKLNLIKLVVILVLFLVLIIWQKYARLSFIRVRKAIAIVNANLQENISGIRVVQSFNREDKNSGIFSEMNAEHLDANIQAGRLSAILFPVVEILTAGSIGLVIIFGGRMVITDDLAIGSLIAFILYIQRFFDPIRSLTMQYSQFQRAMVSGARIFDLLDTPIGFKEAANAKDLSNIKGQVIFDGVGFEYLRGVKVLHDINLNIEAGQTVALVGATGAGKTTIASLITRFYDVTNGKILIDGYDVNSIRRESISQQTATVLQEPFLFSGTIRENIIYNKTSATAGEMIAASKAVMIHNFIASLPQGYDTHLQERGGNLSLGQRQLITYARALVANPRILVLDEATASIDSQTEAMIQAAIAQILSGRTAIVIAHRLSTVRNVDKIIVMDDGRIVEEGTHSELINNGNMYSMLYKTYFTSEKSVAK